MKKNIKFTLIALLAVFGLAACDNNEYEYTGAPRTEGAQVYFPQENTAAVELSGLEGTFNVPISRVDTTKEATVTFTADATSANFTLPQQVAFAKGQKDAQLEIAYTGLEYDKVDTITIKLDSAFVTPYGVSEYKFTVKCPAPWTSLGMGKFRDSFMGDETYVDVEIQQNDLNPDLFRMVRPYHAIAALEIEGEVNYEPSADICEYFQFEVVKGEYSYDYVFFPYVSCGYYNATYEEDILVVNPGSLNGLNTEEGCKFNKVVAYQENGLPGVIELAPFYFLMNQGGGWNYTQEEGIMEIIFPGFVKADYSASLKFVGVMTGVDNNTYAIADLTLGDDVTDVLATVVPADYDAMAVADALVAGELESVPVRAGRIQVAFDADALESSSLQVIAVVVVNEEAKAVANAKFEYYGGGKNPWKSLGTGLYTDDILTPSLYGEDENGNPVYFDPIEYPVEVLENIETPGLYRLVDAYGPNVYPLYDALTEAGFGLAPAGQYFVIDATHPDCVMIPLQEIGFDYGQGVTSVMSVAYNLYASGQATIEELTKAQYGGIESNGVIVFPDFNTQDGQFTFQGYMLIGGQLVDYIGYNGSIKLVLPEAVESAKLATARKNARARRFAVANNLVKQTKAKSVKAMKIKRMLLPNITKGVLNHEVKF